MERKTTVINLLGGSGIGKSTTAAGIFHQFKLENVSCELVTEYVKTWAWEGRNISELDQFYITGKQSRYESRLYGKVDYIITDSPVMLGAFYEFEYAGEALVTGKWSEAFLEFAKTRYGVQHDYFLLKRLKPYRQDGRFQNEKEARALDDAIEEYLIKNNIPYTVIDIPDEDRPNWFLEHYELI